MTQEVKQDHRPKVFFSFPYAESEKLKPIFREACEKVVILAVFADEHIRPEENVFYALHTLILSCDAVVAVIPRSISSWVNFELEYALAINKPVLFFTERPFLIPFDVLFRVITYETAEELRQHLVAALSTLRSNLSRPEYALKKKEEQRIFEALQGSLQKNVLVLGKDSDKEGRSRIERISSVLRSKGYEPIKLRELPEIKHLSLEDKMIRFGGLCRFVVAEDSRPSGHIDEIRLCASCQYITATVREAGTASTWMQAHYPQQYNFMNRFCYKNKKVLPSPKDDLCVKIYDTLEIATEEAATWAEKRIGYQEKIFGRTIYSNW